MSKVMLSPPMAAPLPRTSIGAKRSKVSKSGKGRQRTFRELDWDMVIPVDVLVDVGCVILIDKTCYD